MTQPSDDAGTAWRSPHLPFNPGLNRAVIADLPGLPVGVAGTPANRWLTSWAIARQIDESPAIRSALAELPSLPTSDGLSEPSDGRPVDPAPGRRSLVTPGRPAGPATSPAPAAPGPAAPGPAAPGPAAPDPAAPDPAAQRASRPGVADMWAASPDDPRRLAPKLRGLDALLSAPDTRGHAEAVALVRRLGLVLGGLVATLVTGPGDARDARPEWPAAQWDRWHRVRQVALGGGIVGGELGHVMGREARAYLRGLGLRTRVALAVPTGDLVLRGLAASLTLVAPDAITGDAITGDASSAAASRSKPAETWASASHSASRGHHGVVVDAGGTGIKRAEVVGGDLARRWPDLPTPGWAAGDPPIAEVLAEAIAEAVRTLPGDGQVRVGLALATYVDATGQPYADQLGPYAPLAAARLHGELAGRVEALAGRPIHLTIRHDGAAALIGARRAAPATDAVIVLGTAIGVGLDPGAGPLSGECPI